MTDQDLWPIDPNTDGLGKSKSKLRQMRIFIACMVIAFILVAAILIWAANDRKTNHRGLTNTNAGSYQTNSVPAYDTTTTPATDTIVNSATPQINNNWQSNNTAVQPGVRTEVRPMNTRDVVDEPVDDADSTLRLQMQTMRDNYENQLALYRQQLEDQRQLIATQRLLIDQLQSQAKTNTPNEQTGYAGFYRCTNCGAGINWVQSSAVPEPSIGGKCPASANGQHFWIRM